MKFEDAKAYIAELTNLGREFNDEEKARLNAVYMEVFKESIPECNCTNRYRDALIKVSIWMRQHEDFNKCDYVIDRGFAFMLNCVYYTNSNITNDIAEQLIETNEEAKKHIHKVDIAKDEEEKPTIIESAQKTKRKYEKNKK